MELQPWKKLRNFLSTSLHFLAAEMELGPFCALVFPSCQMHSSFSYLHHRTVVRAWWTRYESGLSLWSRSSPDSCVIYCDSHPPLLLPSLPLFSPSFLFSNGLVLFFTLYLSIFDLTLILKARSYVLNSREPETDLLSITTSEIHQVIINALGTGLLYMTNL